MREEPSEVPGHLILNNVFDCTPDRRPAGPAEFLKDFGGYEPKLGGAHQLKRGIARLIDAYGERLLEKDEFEPKIRQLKARLTRLEAEEQVLAQEEARRAELRLVIGQLEEFTQRMDQGLGEADWSTRGEIIRALVKQIEVSDDQVRVVYRVNTVPFVKAPNGGISQDCRRRADTFDFPRRGSRRQRGGDRRTWPRL